MQYKGVYKNNPYYEIQGVGLYLGSKCNQDCLYCRDKKLRKHYETTKKSLADTLQFLDTLEGLNQITLVGGEPFMYAKFFTDIYSFTDKKDLRIIFITNSLGLQNDTIWNQYIKDNLNVYIQISYDGHDNSRGYNIFSDKKIIDRCRILLSQNRFSICSVITKNSWNVLNIYNDILTILGDTGFNWMISPLLETNNCKELNKETPVESYLLSLYEFLKLYPKLELPKQTLLKYIRSMNYHTNKKELFIETDGSILRSCFDFTRIGNWKTDNLIDIYNKSNYLSLNNRSDKCTNCIVNELCVKRPEFYSPISCMMRIGLENIIFKVMRDANCSNLEEFERYLLHGTF